MYCINSRTRNVYFILECCVNCLSCILYTVYSVYYSLFVSQCKPFYSTLWKEWEILNAMKNILDLISGILTADAIYTMGLFISLISTYFVNFGTSDKYPAFNLKTKLLKSNLRFKYLLSKNVVKIKMGFWRFAWNHCIMRDVVLFQ